MGSDLRPDLVFVVTSPVWIAYCGLREEWDPLTAGFLDACKAKIDAAELDRDQELAMLWRQVERLAQLYAPSWVSAIEIEGKLIREVEKQPVIRYPEDTDLTRVIIADETRTPLPPRVLDLTLRTPPTRSADGSLDMVLKNEQRESDTGTNSSGLRLQVAPDGEIRIDGYYAGPSAKEFWGDSDHEFWLVIPPGHLPELLAVVMRHACSASAPLEWSQLRRLLEAGNIPHKEANW